MSLHVQYYTKTLALSVMVGKLMGGALGMTLVDPTHRYAGSLLTSPGPSPAHAPALRHMPLRPTAPLGLYGSSYKPHIASF